MVPNPCLGGDVFVKESRSEMTNPWTTDAPPQKRTRPASADSEVTEVTATAHGSKPLAPDFPSSAEDEPPHDVTQLANHQELHAIVGSGTSFHGTLSFSGRVRIDGEFTGQIFGGQVLVIGEGARVQGEIQARRVVALGGKIEANIVARDSIELYLPAEVTGDLRSPEIYMDRGIKFSGTCDMTGKAGDA